MKPRPIRGDGPRRKSLLRRALSRAVRLGLRARITISFAVGTLLTAGTLSVVTLAVSREVLVDDRESGATEFALRNAETARNNLTQLEDLVTQLNTSYGAEPAVLVGGQWVARNQLVFDRDDVPLSLVDIVEGDRRAGRIRAHVDGSPALIIGVPLAGEIEATYYEAVSLRETDSTLHVLSVILLASTAGATLLAAALGYWFSRRTLLPLTKVSEASRLIADGRLDTRIDPPHDRDLARLVTGFNDMAQALEQRIQRDGRFASEVSHELRSPLMTLTASIAVLENSRDALPARAVTALDLLASDIDRFTNLVQDLLEISRFDVGTARLELDNLLVIEFIRQVLRHEGSRHVPVELTSALDELVIRADKRRLGRVMSNLLGNARKYAGGATRVELSHNDRELRIAVEDLGPGVLIDERELIFDRFSRGSAGSRRGGDTGVGLGLSLVAEDVNLHGGQVWVEDRSDGQSGSRFVVALPIRRSEQ